MPRRSHFPKVSGRYLLCEKGLIHPLRVRGRVRAVAIVNLRLKQDAGRFAKNVKPAPPPRTRGGKIDLSKVPSSMELLAASWRRKDA